MSSASFMGAQCYQDTKASQNDCEDTKYNAVNCLGVPTGIWKVWYWEEGWLGHNGGEILHDRMGWYLTC